MIFPKGGRKSILLSYCSNHRWNKKRFAVESSRTFFNEEDFCDEGFCIRLTFSPRVSFNEKKWLLKFMLSPERKLRLRNKVFWAWLESPYQSDWIDDQIPQKLLLNLILQEEK